MSISTLIVAVGRLLGNIASAFVFVSDAEMILCILHIPERIAKRFNMYLCANELTRVIPNQDLNVWFK